MSETCGKCKKKCRDTSSGREYFYCVRCGRPLCKSHDYDGEENLCSDCGTSFSPSEFLFCCNDCDGEEQYTFTSKTYWAKEECITDGFDPQLNGCLAKMGLIECMESTFESDHDKVTTITALTNAGFVYSKDMEDLCGG